MTIGVILRAYNNPLVEGQIEALNQTGLIDRIVVVTDAARDKDGFTKKIVSNINQNTPEEKHAKIQMIEHNDYSWSNALNAGCDALLLGKWPVDRVLCLSNEVDFKGREGLQALIEAADYPAASCGFALYEGRDEPSYQLPRNTCSLWHADLLRDYYKDVHHYFDPATDSTGGMEDVLTALRIFKRGIEKGKICAPVISSMRAGIKVPSGAAFDKKMAHENNSLDYVYGQFPPEVVRQFMESITEKALDAGQPIKRNKAIQNGNKFGFGP